MDREMVQVFFPIIPLLLFFSKTFITSEVMFWYWNDNKLFPMFRYIVDLQRPIKNTRKKHLAQFFSTQLQCSTAYSICPRTNFNFALLKKINYISV